MMTAKQLIEHLQEMPPDKPIQVFDRETESFFDPKILWVTTEVAEIHPDTEWLENAAEPKDRYAVYENLGTKNWNIRDTYERWTDDAGNVLRPLASFKTEDEANQVAGLLNKHALLLPE